MAENGNGKTSKVWEWGMKLVIASFIPVVVGGGAAMIKMYDRIGDYSVVHTDHKEAIEEVDKKVEQVNSRVDKNEDRIENMQEVKLDIRGLEVQLERIHEDIKEIKELQYRRMSDHP